MDIKTGSKKPNYKTVFDLYCLFFLIMALWVIIPHFFVGASTEGKGFQGSLMLRIPFSVLCLISCLGIFKRSRLFGYVAGNITLAFVLINQSIILVTSPYLNPLIIFSFINFVAVSFVFSKLLEPLFTNRAIITN